MSAESKTATAQENVDSVISDLGKGKYGRIFKMAHSPSREEYRKTAFIAGLGMVILGAVGFFIYWIMDYLPDYF